MINTNKLKGRIVEKGLTQGDVAKALNLATPTVSQKINNVRAMSLEEAFKIAELLDITDDQFREYFFKEEIA